MSTIRKKVLLSACYCASSFFLVSCMDRDVAVEYLIGSWEMIDNGNNDSATCIDYLPDGRYQLYTTISLPSVPALVSSPINRPDTELAGGESNQARNTDEGTSLIVGYWGMARGVRHWQRGTMVLDAYGNEVDPRQRALSPVTWFVLKFDGKDSFVSIQVEDHDARLAFERAADCSAHSANIKTELKTPAWGPPG